MDLLSLRKNHPEIVYRSFSWNFEKDLNVKFEYFIPPRFTFTPSLTIRFPSRLPPSFPPKPVMDNLVFHLGLIDLFSYWKLVCAPTIKIQTGFLSKTQVAWWNKLLISGMGEYFYKNKIDYTTPEFVRWKIETGQIYKPQLLPAKEQYLVLVSGGKDSLFTRQILTELGKDIVPLGEYTLTDSQKNSSSPVHNGITAYRRLDPLLLELNNQSYLNGHVPFSAYLAFLSLTVAGVMGNRFVVVGNEKSANEANVAYLDRHINHQYSKTYEFEKDFRSYVRSYITNSISYFSLLRPLYELQIAQLFAGYPELVKVFSSCNRYKSSGTWCGACPKCLSIFILLAPFAGVEKMTELVGKNLLTDSTLLPLFKTMLLKESVKPFECVATFEETQTAVYLIWKSNPELTKESPLIEFFVKYISPATSDWEEKSRRLLSQWDNNHFISDEIANLLKEKVAHANT